MSYPVRRDWSRTWPSPRWDPLAEFEAMRDRMNRFFGEVFGGPGTMRPPGVDVECDETDDAWLVEARLPGFAPEDVNVELVQRELSITARQKDETERPGARMTRQGDFAYHVTLPGEVDTDAIEAQMENGVLTVRLPKSPAARPHRIEVASGRQLTGAGAPRGVESGRSPSVTERGQARSQAGTPPPPPPPPGAASGPSGMPGGQQQQQRPVGRS